MRKGRKGTMMVALVALLVAIFATAAYAATINCTGGPCKGTGDPDTLNESAGNDQMYGYGARDFLDANNAAPGDTDTLRGGRNNDDLVADDGDGDDVVYGGRGRDGECTVDEGDEVHECDGNVTRLSN